MTTLIISEEDAKLFIQFQKNYDVYSSLSKELDKGIGYGKLTMNFAAGVLQNIVREEIVYKR